MKKIIVAVSGASGAIYASRLLLAISGKAHVHLIVSDVAKSIMQQEINFDIKKDNLNDYFKKQYNLKTKLSYELHDNKNFYAAIASGSYRTDGMIVIPCSMKTLSGVSHGSSLNLIERAADVTLKERRPLLLVCRETPLSRIHIKNMLEATDAGATIVPATPGFYHGETEINQMIDFIAGRCLNLLNIEQSILKEWGTKDK
jgi:flavin prenyltransferase